MDSKEDDVVAGPSNRPQPVSLEQKPSTSKSVRWDSSVRDNSQGIGKDSKHKLRRQSMVGTPGYVSQLLGQHLVSESEKMRGELQEQERKPIRKQTLEERRASLRAAEADTEFFMKEITFPKPTKSTSTLKLVSTTAAEQDILQEQERFVIPLSHDPRPSSQWRPSHILEDEKVGMEQERSWVGTYIVGKDYWAEKEKNGEEASKKVGFSMDEEKTPWYDMPILEDTNESKLLFMKSFSGEKIEALKREMDEEYEQKRKERMISAAHAREEPKLREEWSEEFKMCFEDVSRSNNFLQRGTHISMPDADKWLEKAGILDHAKVTLIHTGLCFLASGGSRHRGLTFDDFTLFLQMVSHARDMPLKDVVARLTACLRSA